MKLDFQFLNQEIVYKFCEEAQAALVVVENKDVIHISEIAAAFESAFGVLVELVQVDIGEELGGVIADGEAFAVGHAEERFVGWYVAEDHLVSFDDVVAFWVMKYSEPDQI